jgi:hypothetical protein
MQLLECIISGMFQLRFIIFTSFVYFVLTRVYIQFYWAKPIVPKQWASDLSDCPWSPLSLLRSTHSQPYPFDERQFGQEWLCKLGPFLHYQQEHRYLCLGSLSP